MSMQNKLRHLREKLGMSQRDLATIAGTSQQQIARIETGNQSVKLDLALVIAAALKADLGNVFPGTRKLLGRRKKRKDRDALVEMRCDPTAVSEFDAAGVDLNPATWILKLRMRGGAQLDFVCSTAEAQRIRRSLRKSDTGTPFIVFNSSVVAVALNLEHLLHYHELWDGNVSGDWHDDNVPRDEVAVYLSDSIEPLVFDVEADQGTPEDEDDEGQMRGLLFTLETFFEPGEFVSFRDVDGEDAFFRAEDIALLTIPLRVLDARLNETLLDADEYAEEDLPSESPQMPSNKIH
jgi:transcriptional regulator with XRE-family HTH domain